MFLGGKSKELLATPIGQTIKAEWLQQAEEATGGLSTREVTFSGVFTGMNPQEVRVDRTLKAGERGRDSTYQEGCFQWREYI